VLFERYRARVYAIAYRIVGSQPSALDIVQESFSLLLRKLDSFHGNSLFSTWLFRLVVNCSIDYRRKERSQAKGWLVLTDDFDAEDGRPGPDAAAETREVGDQMQLAIGMLRPKLRVILALRYLEDMSYEELAATLGISLGTVKSRLARAHLALERVLVDSFPQLAAVARGRVADGGPA
jgi:RNA polymerase sigma-70 factor (ECF subfamily)